MARSCARFGVLLVAALLFAACACRDAGESRDRFGAAGHSTLATMVLTPELPPDATATLPYSEDLRARLETLARTSRPVLMDWSALVQAVDAARVVFIPDLHTDRIWQGRILRLVDRLADARVGTVPFAYVGLEFLFEDWTTLPSAEVAARIEHTFGGVVGARDPWLTTEIIGVAGRRKCTVLALNWPEFLTPDTALERSRQWLWQVTQTLRERDERVIATLRSRSDRGIVVYGRDHVLSGNIVESARGHLILVPYDPELWSIAGKTIDLSALSGESSTAIRLSDDLILVHLQ